MFEWMFRHREMVAERFRHIQHSLTPCMPCSSPPVLSLALVLPKKPKDNLDTGQQESVNQMSADVTE